MDFLDITSYWQHYSCSGSILDQLDDTILLHVLLPLPSSDVLRAGAACKALWSSLLDKGTMAFWRQMLPDGAALGSHGKCSDAWLHVLLDFARLSSYMDSLRQFPLAGETALFHSSEDIDKLIAVATQERQKNTAIECAGQPNIINRFLCSLRFNEPSVISGQSVERRSNAIRFRWKYIEFNVHLLLAPSKEKKGMMKLMWKCNFNDLMMGDEAGYIDLSVSGSIVAPSSAETALPRIRPFGCSDEVDGNDGALPSELPIDSPLMNQLLHGHGIICKLRVSLASMGSAKAVHVDQRDVYN